MDCIISNSFGNMDCTFKATSTVSYSADGTTGVSVVGYDLSSAFANTYRPPLTVTGSIDHLRSPFSSPARTTSARGGSGGGGATSTADPTATGTTNLTTTGVVTAGGVPQMTQNAVLAGVAAIVVGLGGAMLVGV
ncbi:hypothetical protein B0H63DRAFT_558130 [Podospora didyma]|uniref:Uncharacterized protein n=1 Tax=Podospora didyma TaxID=330526 RepID=A0AAE0NRM2_9PEZI|nr:hypothetical protein B0H63DRAFT_558130 [Podospora didyma]